MTRSAWSEGRWTTPPVAASEHDGRLMVTCAEGSDAWRITSYGFVHDDEHALVGPFPDDSAVEVSFEVELSGQFDQAGLFIRGSDRRWIKAGIEVADGVAQLGAVVTDEYSDWSVAPVPDWNHHRATIRASRTGDAVTVRARRDDGPWQLVRLAHLRPGEELEAGPFCCAPTRAGLEVTFVSWETGPADASLH
ncbi:MAG: DUF1349 domain-containing protein [Propionibacterium sp.]|nr:DUF1349 domain-containing protein [Propionibacterium sp.]